MIGLIVCLDYVRYDVSTARRTAPVPLGGRFDGERVTAWIAAHSE
jgi:hypothetical protein